MTSRFTLLIWVVLMIVPVAGGVLVSSRSQTAALGILSQYLATRSIAVASVVGGLLDPLETRVEKLADSYDKHIFGGKHLSALRNGPRIYFNATNLATGNLFFFVAGGEAAEEMGDYELGVVDAAEYPVCRAVAASSAFPPIFPPLRMDPEVYSPAERLGYVTLTDGGVYDNMGANPLLLSRNKLDYVIISDGGKPFTMEERPTEYGIVVLRESLSIMMEQIRGLEFDRIEHRHKAGMGPKPLWFSIDSTEGEEIPGDAAFASSIRTDLRRLSSEELAVLARHGGSLLGARIATYAPELLATP